MFYFSSEQEHNHSQVCLSLFVPKRSLFIYLFQQIMIMVNIPKVTDVAFVVINKNIKDGVI